jgi:N-acetylneuraminic acid mutarotase
MPTPRDHTAAAVVAGVLHVAAGRPGGMAVHEAYDPRTGHWSTLAPLPLGRSSVAGAAFGGRFLVIGGEDAAEQNVYREVDAYDPRTQRWTRLRPLPAGLQGIGAVADGSRLLLPGGGPAAGGAQQSDRLLVLSVDG